MIEPTETELEEIWKFVNHFFGYCYPSDMVSVSFTTCEDFLKMSKEAKQGFFNKMEIEARAHAQVKPENLENEKDAQISLIKEEDGLKKWCALVFTDRLNRKNRMLQEFLRNRYSRYDYMVFLLIHEFTHVLEHFTNRQLLIEPWQDLKMFLLYEQEKRKT